MKQIRSSRRATSLRTSRSGTGEASDRCRRRKRCCLASTRARHLSRPCLRSEARRQSVQIRHDRLDRFPHLARHHRGEQFLRQGHLSRAVERSDPVRGTHYWPLGWPGTQMWARETSASGLAAVWARDNTREALWDAMARKEVFATTGTRLIVRVFGGFDFSQKDLDRSDFAAHGYAKRCADGRRSQDSSRPAKRRHC